MKPLDKGKWAEKQAEHVFEDCSRQAHDFAWHRYPDSRSAQGPLAKQPSDYLLGISGRILHLEVKETKEIRRLPKAKIRQYGMLLKWHYAGIQPFIVVYRSELNDWTYLGAEQLFGFEECPPSFDLTQRPIFHSCSDVLTEIFK